ALRTLRSHFSSRSRIAGRPLRAFGSRLAFFARRARRSFLALATRSARLALRTFMCGAAHRTLPAARPSRRPGAGVLRFVPVWGGGVLGWLGPGWAPRSPLRPWPMVLEARDTRLFSA